MPVSILIVDDEEPIRRTFQEWLNGSGWKLNVFTASDEESALKICGAHEIDLAILDWNLGYGIDGLQLLQGLIEFQPDLVAIMITGFAHQATPLAALRMGIRDYLDKNQDLKRETFLAAVGRQIDKIRPAKQQRLVARTLLAFRESVEKVLPLVQSSAILNDPVPLSEAIRKLFRFLLKTTGAADGVLLVRHLGHEDAESFLAYSADGQRLPPPEVPFSSSLAATALSMQEPCSMQKEDLASSGFVKLQSFEKNRSSLLLAPVVTGPGVHVVLELFDKAGGSSFTEADRAILAVGADLAAELLRQALSERQSKKLLFDAVEVALEASRKMGDFPQESPETAVSSSVMDSLRLGLQSGAGVVDSETSLKIAEAIRVLALRHGSPAVQHCLKMIEDVRRMLDEVTGFPEG